VESPVLLSDIRLLVQNLVQHTRPVPAGPEANQAINFGYFKAIRALSAVRSQLFQSYVDPFTLQSGVDEYDVSLYDPPLWRPHRLLVAGTTQRRTLKFRYRSLASEEFEAAEVSRAGSFAVLFYDVLEGMLPGIAAPCGAGATATIIPLADTSGFSVGGLAKVEGIGGTILPGGLTVPASITEYVRLITPNVSITVAPPMAIFPAAGFLVTPIRRRVLKIVPAMSESISGRLYYQYQPQRLVSDTDVLDSLVADHRDMIVWYAASMLLQGVNDSQAARWFEQAQEMRSEAMQACEPLSSQNSEALGSDLWGTD
jgi:hypothetical protein